MKQQVYTILSLTILIVFCAFSTKQHFYPNEKTKFPETIFFIKDSSQYSEDFLKNFKERHSTYKTVSLINDTIILNNDREGAILIPTDLPLNKKTEYASIPKDNKWVTMTIERINYSTIKYEIFINGIKAVKKGTADLEPVFYFGAEKTFEAKDGKTYPMNEYIDISDDICTLSIFVGSGNITQCNFEYACDVDREGTIAETLYKK